MADKSRTLMRNSHPQPRANSTPAQSIKADQQAQSWGRMGAAPHVTWTEYRVVEGEAHSVPGQVRRWGAAYPTAAAG